MLRVNLENILSYLILRRNKILDICYENIFLFICLYKAFIMIAET